MLDLTGMGSVLRGIGFLYWALAVGALGAALYFGKGARGKIIWGAIVLAVFGYLPGQALIEQHQRDTYAKEAWAYFKKKCETEAGEKIYKTYTGVKSVLVVKPLPPATEKDLYDQFWYGDPYSNASALQNRGELHAGTLIRDRKFIDGRGNIGLKFFEQKQLVGNRDEYQRIEPTNTPPYFTSKTVVEKPASRFGIIWEDLSNSEARKHWVAGSRLRVIDLVDNSLVAERTGFFIETGFGSTTGQRRPWQTSRGPRTTCPAVNNGTFEDRWFILKVLVPVEGMQDGK